jgi:hypothetical protein
VCFIQAPLPERQRCGHGVVALGGLGVGIRGAGANCVNHAVSRDTWWRATNSGRSQAECHQKTSPRQFLFRLGLLRTFS